MFFLLCASLSLSISGRFHVVSLGYAKKNDFQPTNSSFETIGNDILVWFKFIFSFA